MHKFISEQTVPLYVFEQDKRVKGKQVQILHDLVTVSGEWTAIYVTDTGISGRRWYILIRKSGNLPVCWYGKLLPSHELLIVLIPHDF